MIFYFQFGGEFQKNFVIGDLVLAVELRLAST
jgi:hypothetical protein